MPQVLILFGTLTGNTQLVAEYIADNLKKPFRKWQIDCLNVADAPVDIFKNIQAGDLILIGSSTWDDGNYPFGMADFLEKFQISPPKLPGVNFGVFGCGDTSYDESFCLAVDKLSQTLTEWGGQEVVSKLKIDGFPEMPETQALTDEWLEKIKSWLTKN